MLMFSIMIFKSKLHFFKEKSSGSVHGLGAESQCETMYIASAM